MSCLAQKCVLAGGLGFVLDLELTVMAKVIRKSAMCSSGLSDCVVVTIGW